MDHFPRQAWGDVVGPSFSLRAAGSLRSALARRLRSDCRRCAIATARSAQQRESSTVVAVASDTRRACVATTPPPLRRCSMCSPTFAALGTSPCSVRSRRCARVKLCARRERRDARPSRWSVRTAAAAFSSITAMARMGCTAIDSKGGRRGGARHRSPWRRTTRGRL